MSEIIIKQVTTDKDLTHFIDFYCDLYKGCEQNTNSLYFDERNTLDKRKNAVFEFCEAEYFMALRDGKAVGRVAAIINRRANERWNTKTVRFGWFDFIDDMEVSKALLQTVENWGRERGMTEILGPISFTDMDKEGMLIEGFEHLGNMYTIYNYPYYPKHIAQIGGYEKAYDYLEQKVAIPTTVPEKFTKVAEIAQKRYNLRIFKPTRHQLMKEGYAEKLFEVLNITYANLNGYSQLSDKQIKQYADSYIKIADTNLVTLITDGDNGEVVGFGISFPSFSQALKKLHKGRLMPFGWWHLMKVLLFHKTDTVDLLLIGVLPEYRAKGANALIYYDLMQYFFKYGFKYANVMPQLESNKVALANWAYFDATPYRHRRCYKKTLG